MSNNNSRNPVSSDVSLSDQEKEEIRHLENQDRKNPFLREQDGDVWNPNYVRMFERRNQR